MIENLIRFYGRRKGKPIRNIRAELMEKLLPQLSVQIPAKGKIKFNFGIRPKKLYLEVGFGGGEHLAELALKHPDIGFVGAEPFLNGVASLLAHLSDTHEKGVGKIALSPNRTDNVRIWPDDVRQLFEKLPDEIFEGIFVLYPDPWPKKRHAERRFIGPDNIPELWRLLSPKGKVYLATDVENYAAWAKEKMDESQIFTQVHSDIFVPPKDWVPTRYELKGIAAGRSPIYMIFQKKEKKLKKNLTNPKK